MSAARGLALLRIGLGLEFAIWAWAKTNDGWLMDGSALTDLLSQSLPHAEPAYGRFLESLVLPNADIVARLVTIAEWTAAVMLTLGLLTRAGSVVGMWLMVNFILMRGALDVTTSIDRVFFLVCLVCLVTSAGEVWGVDGLRTKRQRATNMWSNPRTAAAAPQPLLTRAVNGAHHADRARAAEYAGIGTTIPALRTAGTGR